VAALKKNRDNMLDDLAVELSGMSSELAAKEVRLLDDETASLVLARMPSSQRKAILNSLDRKRARVLDRKARTWAAK
jgi:flagellar motility protein MotE (MotC chaperone)